MAFSLTNTFVKDDELSHARFRNRAQGLLNKASDWHRFKRIADHAVLSSLPSTVVRVDTLVQAVTLRVILVGLLGTEDAEDASFPPSSVETVSSLITKLWALSKHPEPIDPTFLPLLNQHLRALVPDTDAYPNPLDFVIPAWETMWRVVATTFAHVYKDDRFRRALEELHVNPSITQFRLQGCDPSAESLIIEAMRLHPPSKHISRSVPSLPSFLPRWMSSRLFDTLHVADVWAVHYSPAVWGSSVETFDPSRHMTRTPEQEEGFLAFGYGRLQCVAKNWAPMAAATILSSILAGLDEKYRVRAGKGIGGRDGWEGWEIVALPTAVPLWHDG
ncbi:cytochrome P450 [Desarmillaria tabescens]|uniref:Cytochrome P450 n=1 Tax=Armillaria tabescens TaxID=1929756 RepID=A0AA39K6I4_ARMTA|nr:cytochrome P450 [Desarmillaria tabescens]KAK0455198.1 cytochrome P450 [Desarmillaria tabescens]